MDIPEELRGLVDELGEALVSAMVLDDRCRDLTTRIQAAGFDLSLSLEAMATSLWPRGFHPIFPVKMKPCCGISASRWIERGGWQADARQDLMEWAKL
jgi:hypothetical protein